MLEAVVVVGCPLAALVGWQVEGWYVAKKGPAPSPLEPPGRGQAAHLRSAGQFECKRRRFERAAHARR